MILLFKYFKLIIKSKLEYRLNFVLELFINIFTYVVTYISIWVLMNKFGNINGWKYYEVMLLYNFNLFTYGMASQIFFMPMKTIENMVKEGTFDNMLTKPINPFLHLLLNHAYLGFLGHIILGIVVFGICFVNLHIDWDCIKIIAFLILLIAGILIQASILIFSGALSFKFVQASAFMDTLIYGVRNFINYPITIYSGWMQIILMCIIPYALVNFYPTNILLGKYSGYRNIGICAICIIVGIVLFGLSYGSFKRLINKYQSAGG